MFHSVEHVGIIYSVYKHMLRHLKSHCFCKPTFIIYVEELYVAVDSVDECVHESVGDTFGAVLLHGFVYLLLVEGYVWLTFVQCVVDSVYYIDM